MLLTHFYKQISTLLINYSHTSIKCIQTRISIRFEYVISTLCNSQYNRKYLRLTGIKKFLPEFVGLGRVDKNLPY